MLDPNYSASGPSSVRWFDAFVTNHLKFSARGYTSEGQIRIFRSAFEAGQFSCSAREFCFPVRLFLAMMIDHFYGSLMPVSTCWIPNSMI